MNNLPRHVVVDLLPLYFAGELSPETQRLVAVYLRTDEDLAARVQNAADDSALRVEADGPIPPELELRSIRRTRMLLTWQRWLFGLGVGFTAVGLSTAASLGHGKVDDVHLMLRDYPIPFGACLVIGALCWTAYYRMRRNLSA